MGADRVRELLPPLLRAVREAEQPVVWACDPMHANVFKTATGIKTRRFEVIMDEIETFSTYEDVADDHEQRPRRGRPPKPWRRAEGTSWLDELGIAG